MTTTGANAATQSPIINRPYLPPTRYWTRYKSGALEPTMLQLGRHPASGLLAVTPDFKPRNPVQAIANNAESQQPRLELVNDIRAALADWQAQGWPRATTATKELLAHWHEPQDRGLYFAQREAISAIIWLHEAAPECQAGQAILTELQATNDAFNEGLPRIACQLATGAGKTAVMAALILWQTVNHALYPNDPRFTNRFLALGPGITVKDRLRNGLTPLHDANPNTAAEYLQPILGLTPPHYEKHLRLIHLQTENWHSFLPRDPDLKAPAGAKKAARMKSRVETPKQIIRRVLGDHPQPVIVINDEAHHCHHGDPEKPDADKDNSYVWYNALKLLRKQNLLHSSIYDFSATPFFSENSKAPLFPWLVSQYDLHEAEEAGIVKIMRLPDADRMPRDGVAAKTTPEQLLRNIYTNSKDSKTLDHQNDQHANRHLKAALRLAYEHWNDQRCKPPWSRRPSPPAIAVIVNTTKNADALFQYVAGWRDPDSGEAAAGRVGEGLSNYDPNTLEPYPVPRTLLVHSKLEGPEDSGTDKFMKLQANAYRKEYPGAYSGDKALLNMTDAEILRFVLNTVGKKGMPGEQIRCVISVGMLTEGWDAKNVRYTIGFRRFGTQLLCEQVAGRTLRRMTHDIDPETGQLIPEYAEVLGIDFQNLRTLQDLPNPGLIDPQTFVQTPDYYDVSRAEERIDQFKVRWPNILGYRRSATSQPLQLLPPADWSQVPPHQVPNPDQAERSVTTIPDLGAGEAAELLNTPATREEFAFLTASLLTNRITELERNNATAPLSRRNLFQQAYSLFNQTITAQALLPPDQEASAWPNRYTTAPEQAALWLLERCHSQQLQPGAAIPVKPIKGEPEWLTASRLQAYTTARRHHYPTEKSEVNIAVCDSGWEVTLAQALDRHPGVERWIRNERLGWSIPWKHDGITRRYEPDFVAVCPLPDGRKLHLVIEVKGQEDYYDTEKARWTRDYWLPAVNADPNYSAAGPWDYLYLDREYFNQPASQAADLEGNTDAITKAISDAIAKHSP